MPARRERPPIYVIEFETPSLDEKRSWKEIARRQCTHPTQPFVQVKNENDHLKLQGSTTKPSWAHVVQQSVTETTHTKTNQHHVAVKKAQDDVLDATVSTITSTGANTTLFKRVKESQKELAEQTATLHTLQETRDALTEQVATLHALLHEQNKLQAEHVKKEAKLAQYIVHMQEHFIAQTRGEVQRVTNLEDMMTIMTDMLEQLKVSQAAIECNNNAIRPVSDLLTLAILPDRVSDL